MARLTIYTSIPPTMSRAIKGEDSGVEYQNACIDSWRRAGLRIISVNSRKEIQQLKSRGIDVELISNGTEDERTTIPYLLSLIEASKISIVGIVNADCLLVQMHDFCEAMSNEAAGSIILFERLNINQHTLRPTGLHCYGFDAFFFDTRFIPKITAADRWSIGQPFWDYWLPVALIAGGAKLKIGPPAFIHLVHELKWNWPDWGSQLAAMRYDFLAMRDHLPPDFIARTRTRQTKARFAHFVFFWLRASASKVTLCPKDTGCEFLYRVFSAIMESSDPPLADQATLARKILRELKRRVIIMRSKEHSNDREANELFPERP